MPEKPRKEGEPMPHRKMPYYSKFTSDLKPGQTIFIKGFLRGVNFDIGLYCGKNVAGPNRDNIAVLLAGRLDNASTSLYSMVDGNWSKEETVKLGIRYKDEFSVRIRMREDCFEIWAQYRKVTDYEYTVPLNSIQCIYIVGEIDLYRCDWEGRYYPEPFACFLPPGVITVGRTIYIAGFVLRNADMFEVGLKSNTEYALWINTKMRKKLLTRNSTIDGNWSEDLEKDLESKNFPLERNKAFEAMIDICEEGFNIYLNGQYVCSFKHRYALDAIDNLVLEGDVDVHSCSWV